MKKQRKGIQNKTKQNKTGKGKNTIQNKYQNQIDSFEQIHKTLCNSFD